MPVSDNPVDYFLVLAHMIRSPVFIRQAATQLLPEHFTDPEVGGLRAQAVLFGVFKSYFDRFGVAPDRAVSENEALQMVNRLLNPQEPEYHTVMSHVGYFWQVFFPMVDQNSLPLARSLCERIYTACVVDQQRRTLVDQAMREGDFKRLGEQLQAVERQAMGTTSSENRITDVTAQLTNDTGQRFRTGISFIDQRLGNGQGPVSGCCLGIIAPQGAGKTTLGVQFTVSQAVNMGRPALLILAEAGYTLTVQRNVLACATGIEKSIWEQNNNNVDQTLRAVGKYDDPLLRAKLDALRKNLHVFDLVNNGGSLEAVEAEIDQMCDSGHPPVVSYLDWAGILADKVLSLGHAGRRFDKLEPAIKHVSSVLVNKAAATNLFCVVAQQMDSKASTKGPTAEHNAYVARDCKAFLEQFKYGLTVNSRDPVTNLTSMQLVKTRDDELPPRWIARLCGATAVFEEASGYRAVGKRFLPNKKGPEHGLPKES